MPSVALLPSETPLASLVLRDGWRLDGVGAWVDEALGVRDRHCVRPCVGSELGQDIPEVRADGVDAQPVLGGDAVSGKAPRCSPQDVNLSRRENRCWSLQTVAPRRPFHGWRVSRVVGAIQGGGPLYDGLPRKVARLGRPMRRRRAVVRRRWLDGGSFRLGRPRAFPQWWDPGSGSRATSRCVRRRRAPPGSAKSDAADQVSAMVPVTTTSRGRPDTMTAACASSVSSPCSSPASSCSRTLSSISR